MAPTIDYLLAQAHIEGLRRDAQQSRATEARIRQMLRRSPPRHTTHTTRKIPTASNR